MRRSTAAPEGTLRLTRLSADDHLLAAVENGVHLPLILRQFLVREDRV
jgi:hypothetical protein